MDITKEDLIIAAGPCSAESREQTLSTARLLSEMGVRIFRAGLWKPRSSAGQFEGVGARGLDWLEEVRATTGMRIATEVAVPAHVEICLKSGVDILWIGARTVANPFAVQELAEALRGYKGEVWVKNPVSPELPLWLGAFDRLRNADVENLSAVHRGFSYYDKSHYRNHPQWDIPIEFKRRNPDVALICDPSHIGGRRELIESLCRYALDLCYDGLMIESHCEPDKALSDASQQVTPASLSEIFGRLEVKRRTDKENRLAELRGRIDECDGEIMELLGRRMRLCDEIGAFKKREGIGILQTERYNDMLASRITQGEVLGLDPVFVKRIMDTIHLESIALQADEKRLVEGGVEE